MPARSSTVVALAFVVAALVATSDRASVARADDPTRREHPLGVDRHGDPLPPGALARMGTIRGRHGAYARRVAWHPRKDVVATCGGDAAVRLWDLEGRSLDSFEMDDDVKDAFWSPSGERLVAWSTRYSIGYGLMPMIAVWDVASKAVVCRWTPPERMYLSGVTLVDDERVILAGAKPTDDVGVATTGVLLCVRLTAEPRVEWSRASPKMTGGVISPDRREAAIPGEEGPLFFIDAATGATLDEWTLPEGRVGRNSWHDDAGSLAYSSDGSSLLVGVAPRAEDQRLQPEQPATVLLLDRKTGERKYASTCARGGFSAVHFLTDDAFVYSADDGASGVLTLGTPAPAIVLSPAGGSLSLSPDRRRAALLHGGLQIVDLTRRGTVSLERPRHARSISGLRFLGDGKELLSVAPRDGARVWDATTGEQLRRFTPDGGSGPVVSPDEKRLALLSESGLGVWRIADGTRLWETRPAAGPRWRFIPQTDLLAWTDADVRRDRAPVPKLTIANAETGEVVNGFPLPGLCYTLFASSDGDSVAAIVNEVLSEPDAGGLQRVTPLKEPCHVVDRKTGEITVVPALSSAGGLGMWRGIEAYASEDGRFALDLERAAPYRLRIWETRDWTKRRDVLEPVALSGRWKQWALSRDGETLAVATPDGSIGVVRVAGGAAYEFKATALLGRVSAIALSPDGRRIAIGDEGGNVTAYPAGRP